MTPKWLSGLLGTAPVVSVAQELGKKLGAPPSKGDGPLRIHGAWNGMRCQVTLDGKADHMTVTVQAPPHGVTWEIVWAKKETAELTLVSTNAALSPVDAARMEKLPMKVRLHVIEVVEAGRGSIGLAGGKYTLHVTAAGLGRPNAVAQASIRLDVLKDLVAAAGKALS